MGFLVPAFLAALAALGIPLWMHLRDRNESSPTRFPSLMFLVRLPIRSADRRRVTDWPLLALRALIVALLVLAFARPYAGEPAAVATSDRARAVVLVLDRSLSMGHGGTWAAARDSALALLGALGADDRVAVVLFDEEATVAVDWTGDLDAARAAVAVAAPVPRGTRFGAALRAARGLVAAAPPAAREVVVISDLQRTGLGGVAGLEWPDGVPLRAVVPSARQRANAAVAGVEARRTTAGSRSTLVVQARLVARELAAPRTARVTLLLAGREVAARDVALPPSGERTVVFDAVAAPAGVVRGEVRLGADQLPGDDAFHFALGTDDALRVVVLVPDDLARDETLYLERALAIGRSPAVRVERRPVRTLDAEVLGRAALLLFWDVVPPGGELGAAVDRWIAAGAGVVVHAGPRLAARRSTLLATASTDGLADRRAAGGAVLGETRGDHALFAPFRAAPAALGAPRYWRYARLTPAVGTEVLARFDDGSAALVERRAGEGRIIVSALALDVRDSDFPLQPAFLPLMRRLALHGSGHASAPLARSTGDVWLPRGVRRSPVIVAPDGAILRPEPGVPGGPTVTLERPGVYAAYEERVDGAPRALTAVNVPAAESDLTAADPRELLLGVGRSEESGERAAAPATPIEVEGRQRLWRALLLVALAALALEAVWGARGWRGHARRASIETSGGSAG
jgi:Mg-chelatase subunit ChlD